MSMMCLRYFTAASALALALALAGPVVAAPPAAWVNNCQICHQADGKGLAGQFPRLAGRIGAIAATPEGKAWLPSVVLKGMGGRIVVDGTPIIGVMPGFATLSDADIATTLNFAAQAGKAGPFKPADIAAARKTPAGPGGPIAARAVLVTAGIIK